MNKANKAEKILNTLVNHEISLQTLHRADIDKVFHVQRFADLLELLRHPQSQFFSIQVAGTNGKGSTVFYLEQILHSMGFATGAFYSPHLVTLHERIHIRNQNIDDNYLAKLLNFIRLQVNGKEKNIRQGKMTYFEALTAAAFICFAKEKVDCAVMETGLGGRLDSVTQAKAAIGILTSIGLDHTHILGDTLEEILLEKLGIVHQDMTLLVGNLKQKQGHTLCPASNKTHDKSSLLEITEQYCAERKIALYRLGKDFFVKNNEFIFFTSKEEIVLRLSSDFSSVYLPDSFSMALAAAMIFLQKNKDIVDNKRMNSVSLQQKRQANVVRAADYASQLKMPGRMELLNTAMIGGRNIHFYFDGAHNPAAIQYAVDYIRHIDNSQNNSKNNNNHKKNNMIRIVFFAAFKDKPLTEMVQSLQTLPAILVFCHPQQSLAKMQQKKIKQAIPESSQRWADIDLLFEKAQSGLEDSKSNILDIWQFEKYTQVQKFIQDIVAKYGKKIDKAAMIQIFFLGSMASYTAAKQMIEQWKVEEKK